MAQHACMCKKWAFFFLVSPIFLQQQHTFVVHLLEFLSFVTIHSFIHLIFYFLQKKNCSRIKRKALSHNNNIHSFFLFHFLFSILTKIKRWTWFMVKTNVNFFKGKKIYIFDIKVRNLQNKEKRKQKKKYLFISTKKNK